MAPGRMFQTKSVRLSVAPAAAELSPQMALFWRKSPRKSPVIEGTQAAAIHMLFGGGASKTKQQKGLPNSPVLKEMPSVAGSSHI